jgi:hypothetical protein
MADEQRFISRDIYLQALGLFTIANDRYVKGRECENMMNGLLGLEDSSHLSDILFDQNTGPTEFDRALKLSGLTVEELPTPPQQRRG